MKKKRIICVVLIAALCFSSTFSVYASSDTSGDTASTDEIDDSDGLVEKYGELLKELAWKGISQVWEVGSTGFDTMTGAVHDFIYDNVRDWLDKGYIIATTDGVKFSPTATEAMNDFLQEHVREYDGYYLINPTFPDPTMKIVDYYKLDSEGKAAIDAVFDLNGNHNITMYNGYYWGAYYIWPRDALFYLYDYTNSSRTYVQGYSSDNRAFIERWESGGSGEYSFSAYSGDIGRAYKSSGNWNFNELASYTCGTPFKVYKSKYYLTQCLANGRHYVPEFPSSDIFIPKKYVDDPTLLPDITYNIITTDKTETVIQNEYNTTYINYITNLNGDSSGSGGSGGNTGDGSGGDSGGGSGSGGPDVNSGELYDFLKNLWNESDKKLDKMVDLLEENNKYQKKLVDSLNDIKAILVAQTVLDVFKDRSTETANKAKEKFPTSIPWDVALVVNSMTAEPEQLKFTLPIKVQSVGIDESIEVDLTSEEWEKLAKTCRYLLSITFVLLLIHLTRKMFGGDD